MLMTIQGVVEACKGLRAGTVRRARIVIAREAANEVCYQMSIRCVSDLKEDTEVYRCTCDEQECDLIPAWHDLAGDEAMAAATIMARLVPLAHLFDAEIIVQPLEYY